MTVREQAGRTTCDCQACKVGCRTMPGMLGIGELSQIAAYLDVPYGDQFLLDNFQASQGAKVAKLEADGVHTFWIPTITPQQRPGGRCVFLSTDGQDRCGIHPVSPFGCACVDSHQPRYHTDNLVAAALAEIIRDKEYERAWHLLRDSGHVAKPIQERRADFEREYAKHRPQPQHFPPELEA
jgi:hypothetical protein